MWGFNKYSGPGTGSGTGNPQTPFGFSPPSQSPPPNWFNGSTVKPEVHQTGVVDPVFPPHNSGTVSPVKTPVQDAKRARSPPPAFFSYNDIVQNSSTDDGRPFVSPPKLNTRPNTVASPGSNGWPAPSAGLYRPEASANNLSYVPVPKRSRLPFSTPTDARLRGNENTSLDDMESQFVHQRTKSPPHVFQRNNTGQGLNTTSSDITRTSASPPRLSTRPNSLAGSGSNAWSPPSAGPYQPEEPLVNSSYVPVPKRSRLPFSTPTDHPGLQMNGSAILDDTERELQAKAKRMARFKDELSQPEPSETGNKNQKPQHVDQLGVDKRKSVGEASDMTGHLRNSNFQTDEDQDISTVIIGYCPDMCPEQERAERERKGDLDQYERLDGDRNQTTESLAVKKYTRTAEREAALIRPMEILQKTMDYLLNLLEQPYNDRFLGLYNFLWDRMRAIRMDLRMQHIFNLGAITMLEQMIRLHIIAMHELCQYTKGEGFSEGFDAHLNIEQMNKTSVELFQLYDDHRKKGINVPTETEFRGYYALLKLDKHPGYKVEPSELSLDLAKMTPGIRQAEEVLFARNVARACRSGNFVAFFRLVRKASYLQACLMHAHFGKLRTQALASLHSGLQNNQGIPLSLVSKWLGMEEENMEDLLEFHGFSIKEFDEPYMFKERQFLNGDNEYPIKCSKLVHLKRSATVVDDVLSSPLITSLSPEVPKRAHVSTTSTKKEAPIVHKEKPKLYAEPIDNHMANVEKDMPVQPIFATPVLDKRNEDRPHIEHLFSIKTVNYMETASSSPQDIFKNNNSFGSPKAAPISVVKPHFDKKFKNSFEKPSFDTKISNYLEKDGQSNAVPLQVTPTEVVEEIFPDIQMDSPVEDSMVQSFFHEDREPESAIQEVQNDIEVDTSVDEEVAEAKLKLILRLWRRRAFRKKDLREKKQLAANAALSLLSLGPPMRRHYKEQLNIPGDFNIDRAMYERYEKQEQLWSSLNVSDVVAPTLRQRYQHPKCICWKLLFCSLDVGPGANVSDLDLSSWLRHKLMPENIGNDDDLLASSSNLSIWKKLEYGKLSSDWTCYLSVVKNVQFDNLVEETVLGANAVMFLASERVSWEAQKIRLFSLVSLIPYGSCLPLLVLSGSGSSSLVESLGLNEIDKSKICSFSVISLDGFFSDGYLRNGVEWLAGQSPVQPVVRCVKTRELILAHLQCVQFDASDTSPEQCVAVFNDAVDESIGKIRQAAKSNPVGWPCPEISLLSGPNDRIFESYMPGIGWSSATRIEPLIQALRRCKLPSIPNVYRFCDRSFTGLDIENQKLELERFLVSYLSTIMGLALAQNEASILIQKCVGLEFRAYILEQQQSQHRLDNSRLVFNKTFEDESYNLTTPSLDEMIEVCVRPRLEVDYRDSKSAICDTHEVETVVSRDGSMDEEITYRENQNKNKIENDKENENERSLSKLFEQCNIMQDRIDKKLSIYF
ncbi:SAC3 family protein B isoform X2 [Rutidosis leptorrhynchoides]|uniref:SAC3 family protein B isoform X2 n=1 Tax=Rutidosis leptorrhynchoides TaxID=125765 RepID=UPI003A99351A